MESRKPYWHIKSNLLGAGALASGMAGVLLAALRKRPEGLSPESWQYWIARTFQYSSPFVNSRLAFTFKECSHFRIRIQ